MTYENLKKDLKHGVLMIAKFLDITLTDEVADVITERCTFSSMKAKSDAKKEDDVRGSGVMYRKGLAGDWKTSFTVAQSERFDGFFREKFNNLGFEFEYE
ncbi:amine sulfotransferase-like [Glandiceps talaboti]